MKLIAHSIDLKIDGGVPDVKIFAGDSSDVLISYYSASLDPDKLNHRNAVIFKGCKIHKYGFPNDEAFPGYKYYDLEFKFRYLNELLDSEWIAEILKNARIHPSFNEERWRDFKHFIIMFKEGVFECIARDFEFIENVNEKEYS